jgi:hypothetical protein
MGAKMLTLHSSLGHTVPVCAPIVRTIRRKYSTRLQSKLEVKLIVEEIELISVINVAYE